MDDHMRHPAKPAQPVQSHHPPSSRRLTGGLLSNYTQQQSPTARPSGQHSQSGMTKQESAKPVPANKTAPLLSSASGAAKTSKEINVPAQPPATNLPVARPSGLLSQHRAKAQIWDARNIPQTPAPSTLQPKSTRSTSLSIGQALNNSSNRNLILQQMMKGVRGWSGKMNAISNKMAALAGYQIEPPAPYMERYHNPSPAVPRLQENTTAPQPREQIWKRSLILRTAMLKRKRRRQAATASGRITLATLIALAILIIFGSTGTSAYGYVYYQSQLPTLDKLANANVSQTSHIYDRNLSLLYEAYDQHKRSPITYNDVPQVMRDAMVAAEDKTFWTNSGVDVTGIARAALANLAHSSTQGGSTLTQQVIKNISHNDQQSLGRKIPEAMLAIGLTQKYSKEKILEMYFNVASFTINDYGIETAVNEYFQLMPQCGQNFKCQPGIRQLNYNQESKSDDPLLGLARASLLATMPQNPTIYDPTLGDTSRLAALERQKYVLDNMLSMNITVKGLGKLTPEIIQKAEDITARMTFKASSSVKRAPHFVDWIIRQIAIALGNGDYSAGLSAFRNGGYNIRTTVDANLQDYVERAVKHHLTEPGPHKFTADTRPTNIANNVNDGAVVVMNAHTGEILAMNGSTDYNNADIRVGGQFNAADPPPNDNGTAPGRQPGSTYKPFVYATAFEMGWSPGTIVPDMQTYFPNGQLAGTSIQNKDIYHPPDYSANGDPNHYGGNQQATVRNALAESQNVGAVKAMQFAGPENVLRTVQRLGLTGQRNTGVSWALGTNNATLLQMTNAYQTFANDGKRIPYQGILDIWDNYGHNLYHYDTATPPATQVFSPQVTYMMTSILTDEPSRYPEFGRDHDLSFADIDPSCATQRVCAHPVAAKTGTTDGKVGPKDTWTIGYTPNVVVGVWTGNANGEDMAKGTLGIVGAAPIWHSVIETAAGYCGASGDGIPCPENAHNLPQSIGLGSQITFPIPASIHMASTSSYNGLQGAGVYDWMIDGQDPLVTGIPVVKMTDPPVDPTNPTNPSRPGPKPGQTPVVPIPTVTPGPVPGSSPGVLPGT